MSGAKASPGEPGLPARLDAWAVAGTRRWLEAHRRRFGEDAGEERAFAGGVAFFAGVDSPLSKVIGCDRSASAAELHALADFYARHGGGYDIELSPRADPRLAGQLEAHGYRAAALELAFVRRNRPIVKSEALPEGIERIERLRPDDAERAARVLACAAVAPATPSEALFDVGMTSLLQADTVGWVAVSGGEDVACGCHATGATDGIASLFGGATIPEFRGRGVQQALIAARVDDIASTAAEWVVVVAEDETSSARNAQRADFQAAHSWTLWNCPARASAARAP